MPRFVGRLEGANLDSKTVLVDIGDERLRITAGRIPVGSWRLEDVHTERHSLYRFTLDLGGDRYEFSPQDPSGFSDAVGAVVDLSESKGRFGLKAFIEQRTQSPGN